MQLNENELHALGASTFVDDITLPDDVLYAFPVVSEIAHGTIEHINFTTALACAGVVKILSAQDIHGVNNIGNVEADEVLMAERKVVYQGQAIALIIAESATIARKAARLVTISYRHCRLYSMPELHIIRDSIYHHHEFFLWEMSIKHGRIVW